MVEPANIVGRVRPGIGQAAAGFLYQIADHEVNQPAHRFMDEARRLEPRVAPRDLGEHGPDQGHLGPDDPVGAPHDLGLVAGEAVGQQQQDAVGFVRPFRLGEAAAPGEEAGGGSPSEVGR